MFYSLRGMVFSLAALGALVTYAAVDRSLNWKPAKAEISYIDRSCEIIQTVKVGDAAATKTSYRESCNSLDDEWKKVRSTRSEDLNGVAVVHLNYTAPATGAAETGELRFDGHDEEFYRLRAGDQLNILVNNSDPTKFKRA